MITRDHLQVDRVLVLSTRHVRRETADLYLSGDKAIAPTTCLVWPGIGWLAWVDWAISPATAEDGARDFPDLIACFELARALDCGWIRFDCTIEPVEGLIVHDWEFADSRPDIGPGGRR